MLHIRSLEDFAAAWKGESESTAKVLSSLTDSSLATKVWPGGRNLGTIAWHLPTSITEMLGAAGVLRAGAKHDSPTPTAAKAIHDRYVHVANSVVTNVKGRWKDAELGELVPMYGQEWTKGQVLGCLILHEVHHRGQLTVLVRQAGLLVQGVYGPSKEEWAPMGLPAMP